MLVDLARVVVQRHVAELAQAVDPHAAVLRLLPLLLLEVQPLLLLALAGVLLPRPLVPVVMLPVEATTALVAVLVVLLLALLLLLLALEGRLSRLVILPPRRVVGEELVGPGDVPEQLLRPLHVVLVLVRVGLSRLLPVRRFDLRLRRRPPHAQNLVRVALEVARRAEAQDRREQKRVHAADVHRKVPRNSWHPPAQSSQESPLPLLDVLLFCPGSWSRMISACCLCGQNLKSES